MKRESLVAFLFPLVFLGSINRGLADIIGGPIVNPSNGHTYLLLDTTIWSPSGFAASEAQAVSLGGHLATINDADENAWVFNTFSPLLPSQPGILGIGLNDLVTEGNYVWTSGEPFTFSNWDPNLNPPFGIQPNGTNDDVVGIAVGIFTPGRWHDFNTIDDNVFPAAVNPVVEISAIPEPGSLSLFIAGLLATSVSAYCNRRRLRR